MKKTKKEEKKLDLVPLEEAREGGISDSGFFLSVRVGGNYKDIGLYLGPNTGPIPHVLVDSTNNYVLVFERKK